MLRILLVVAMLAGCGGSATTPQESDPSPSGTCGFPLETAADLEACNDDSALPQSNEDVSFGDTSRMVWRFMIESRDPEIITAALATQVQGFACGVTEHTLFATGTPEPGTYNRGRVVIGTDCQVVFDVCTAWETVEGTEFCTAEESFTVPKR